MNHKISHFLRDLKLLNLVNEVVRGEFSIKFAIEILKITQHHKK
jgi:hypothetical protein